MPSFPDLRLPVKTISDKERLPSPSALFGDYLHGTSAFQDGPRSPNSRPVYILPPPSSLLGYHLPPPPPPSSCPPLPLSYVYSHANMSPPLLTPSEYKTHSFPVLREPADLPQGGYVPGHNKRKRCDTKTKPVQHPPSPPYNNEVILDTHTDTDTPNIDPRSKRQKVENEAISAAAATLASFSRAPVRVSEDDDGEACETCVGHGDLACQQCGDSFRHARCLQRHKWEHSDTWKDIQGRLTMSKTQKLQVLEAAQILMDIACCGMRVSFVN